MLTPAIKNPDALLNSRVRWKHADIPAIASPPLSDEGSDGGFASDDPFQVGRLPESNWKAIIPVFCGVGRVGSLRDVFPTRVRVRVGGCAHMCTCVMILPFQAFQFFPSEEKMK